MPTEETYCQYHGSMDGDFAIADLEAGNIVAACGVIQGKFQERKLAAGNPRDLSAQGFWFRMKNIIFDAAVRSNVIINPK